MLKELIQYTVNDKLGGKKPTNKSKKLKVKICNKNATLKLKPYLVSNEGFR